LSTAFAAIGVEWRWVPVTHFSLKARIGDAAEAGAIVLNLCDADASQGMPGVEAIHELEAQAVPCTGADRFFYDLTTSRRAMKNRLRAAGVPQPEWMHISRLGQDLSDAILPSIVKPDVSGGSYGIERSSVVRDPIELDRQLERVFSGDLHGRDFRLHGALIEEFIEGPEYSVMVLGDWNDPGSLRVLPPVERFFADAWPAILTYEINWERYDENCPPPEGPGFWHGKVASAQVSDLEELARKAYIAVGGTGYGRVDIRKRSDSGELAVLEVNANCGLSSDPHSSTVGAILSLHGIAFGQLLSEILEGAVRRAAAGPRRVAVFIPALGPDDDTCWGYGDDDFRLDFEAAMGRSGISSQWHKICRPGAGGVRLPATDSDTVVFNLCDGDDATYPGLSVVRELARKTVQFTGADAPFYAASTSKTGMKRLLADSGVPTASWATFAGDETRFFEEIRDRVGFPCLFKPDISAGSFGIRATSRVASQDELPGRFAMLRAGGGECQDLTSGWFAEAFVTGREFTVLVSGHHDAPESLLAYTPLEYRFAETLPPEERFLFYARRYETDASEGEPERYQYRHPLPDLDAELRRTALEAYRAVGGHGYARVDIRVEESTGVVYVLEVNANCGLGRDPAISTMGAILARDLEPYEGFLNRAIGLARFPARP
jgi:D-alanine-D-alanine ligase